MAQLTACIARHPQTRLHFPSTRRGGAYSPSQAAGATALTVAPARAAAPAVDPIYAAIEKHKKAIRALEIADAETNRLMALADEAVGQPHKHFGYALCGLPPETGPGTIAKWEAGAGPNDPVATLLSLLAVGCDRYPLGEEMISAGDASH